MTKQISQIVATSLLLAVAVMAQATSKAVDSRAYAGDTIWLWSADEDLGFAKGFAKSARDAKFGHLVSKDYPSSDHRSFAVPGVEAYSFSLGPAGEAKNIIKVLKGDVDPANVPKVLQVIHTENDTVEKVDADAAVRSLVVIEAAIRALDK